MNKKHCREHTGEPADPLANQCLDFLRRMPANDETAG